MIIEATLNLNNQWVITHTEPFWGCICNSTTKEGATKVIAMNWQDSPKENAEVISAFYGFISDTSRDELVLWAESQGLELDLPEEND